MRTLQEIKEDIRGLGPDDFAALRRWFDQFEQEFWDRQIEHDAKAGRLAAYVREAVDDHRDGRCTEL